MIEHDEMWPEDEDPGPVTRFYTLTGGRTRSCATGFDVVALVRTIADRAASGQLNPEHLKILDLCHRPVSVAEIAGLIDLPLGVVQVLLGDLLEQDLVVVHQPAPGDRRPDRNRLAQLLQGLREL